VIVLWIVFFSIVVVVVDEPKFQKEVLVLLVLVLAREVRGQDWFGYGNKARKQGALTC